MHFEKSDQSVLLLFKNEPENRGCGVVCNYAVKQEAGKKRTAVGVVKQKK